MISCIIIDDEQHAIEVIRNFCNKIPYLEVKGEFSVPEEAAAFIDLNREDIDLVFLDIEMPRFSGIDFLKAYSFQNVILVTGYSEFALEAYQYGVVDYLMKPFSFDRFTVATSKVYNNCFEKTYGSRNRFKPESSILYLKTERNKYVKIEFANVTYIEGAGNFSVIHTSTHNNKIVVSKRLKELEQQFPKNRFKRVHKSHIVNMDYFEFLDGIYIKLRSYEEKLVLGAIYRKSFLEFINKFQ